MPRKSPAGRRENENPQQRRTVTDNGGACPELVRRALMRSLDPRNLYARFGALIYARCRQILRDDAAAEDATQDVFVRLVQSGLSLDDASMVRWLNRVTTNLCLNRLRDGKWERATGEPI